VRSRRSERTMCGTRSSCFDYNLDGLPLPCGRCLRLFPHRVRAIRRTFALVIAGARRCRAWQMFRLTVHLRGCPFKISHQLRRDLVVFGRSAGGFGIVERIDDLAGAAGMHRSSSILKRFSSLAVHRRGDRFLNGIARACWIEWCRYGGWRSPCVDHVGSGAVNGIVNQWRGFRLCIHKNFVVRHGRRIHHLPSWLVGRNEVSLRGGRLRQIRPLVRMRRTHGNVTIIPHRSFRTCNGSICLLLGGVAIPLGWRLGSTSHMNIV
jgi:hypothetical protein